jgi:hypothetical protein
VRVKLSDLTRIFPSKSNHYSLRENLNRRNEEIAKAKYGDFKIKVKEIVIQKVLSYHYSVSIFNDELVVNAMKFVFADVSYYMTRIYFKSVLLIPSL